MVKAIQTKPLDGRPEGTPREFDRPDFDRLKASNAVREATEEEWSKAMSSGQVVPVANLADDLDARTIEELGQIARAENIEPTEEEMKAHVIAIIRGHRQRQLVAAEGDKDVRRVAGDSQAGSAQTTSTDGATGSTSTAPATDGLVEKTLDQLHEIAKAETIDLGDAKKPEMIVAIRAARAAKAA